MSSSTVRPPAPGWEDRAACLGVELASALAHAHDDGARPALIAMLAVAALRVDAALALEVLAPGLDPVPLLAPLMSTETWSPAMTPVTVPLVATTCTVVVPS